MFGGETMADGTTVDSLQIEVEASSAEAEKKVNALADALERLKKATRGFGGVAKKIKEIGDSASDASAGVKAKQKREALNRASNSVESTKNIITTQVQAPSMSEISKAVDSAKSKYDELIQYLNQNKGKITRDAATEALRQIETEQKNLEKILDKLGDKTGPAKLYAAADALKDAENKFKDIWDSPAPQQIDWGAVQRQTEEFIPKLESEVDKFSELKERLEGTKLGEIIGDTKNIDEAIKKLADMTDKTELLSIKLDSLREKLGNALAKGDMGQVANYTSQIQDIQKKISELSTPAKIKVDSSDVDKATKKIGMLKKILKAIERIAFYRTIRTLISSITGGFKEGIENLYQYSAIMNKDFKRSMDQISTSSLYLKNSLGALSETFINVLAPVLDSVVDQFVEIINMINQVFSAMSGATFYTKAIKQTKEYAKETDKAKDSLKRFTLSIDELNIISLPDTKTKETPDYSGMFEEVEISEPAQEIAKVLSGILDYAKEIGIAFATWKIASRLFPELNKLQLALGSLMIAVGVTLLIDAIEDIIFGDGLTWENILKGGAGGALTGGGLGLMLAKKLGLTWAKGMLLGAVVGLGLSLMVMSIAAQIKDGLNLGNLLLNAIGGALAGGALGAFLAFKLGADVGSGLIGGIVAGIGLSLLISSIIDIFSNGLNIGNAILAAVGGALLGAGIGFFIGGLPGALIGATIGIGLSLVIASIIDVSMGDFDIGNMLLSTIGGALAGVGFALAIGGGGIVVSAIIGVALSWVFTEMAKPPTETMTQMKEILDRCETAANNAATAMENLKTGVANLESVSADFAVARTLVNEIFEINQNANATKEELGLMAAKVDILNGLNIDGLSLSIDETTGRVKESKEAVEELIASLEAEARMEAIRELLVQSYKDQYQALADVKTATDDYTTAQAALDEMMAQGGPKNMQQALELIKIKEAIDSSSEAYDTAKSTLSNLTDATDLYTQQLVDLKNGQTNAKDGAVDWMTTQRELLADANLDIQEYIDKLNSIPKNVTTTYTIVTENQVGRSSGGNATPAYASGGFPKVGQMFIAREAGPELVGKIGQKNTVANNEQITSGIAEGVKDANVDVVNALYAIGSMIVKAVEENNGDISLDGETLVRKIQPYQNRLSTMQGASLVD